MILCPIERLDRKYAAGFFDGEGHITISRPRYGHALKVGASNTDRRVLDKLVRTYGGSVCAVGHKARIAAGHSPLYAWQIHGEKAVRFLESVLPWLVIKFTRTVFALAFQKTKIRYYTGTPEAVYFWREVCRAKMHQLNVRYSM